MKIISWNVNSIKARLDHVRKFLTESAPDILMVQELKGEDCPGANFTDLGYQTLSVCQKAYNGVAVFSKIPITPVLDRLPGDDGDDQARYLEFEANGLRLINIYAPNGNPTPGDKYDYKLAWLERLYQRLKTLREENIPFAIGGDFNVIPEDKDCYNPKAWENDALFKIETRHAFRKLLYLGLTDAFRVFEQGGHHYTFWDYQRGAWQRDDGIRIDHFLLSPPLADRLKSCSIDRQPRGWEKPSDHTPIIIELNA